MCDMKANYLQAFEHPDCSGKVDVTQYGDVTVKGKVNSSSAKVIFWAAAPPNYLQSYSGSGLPFPNPEMAYENTPNKGVVRASNGEFTIKMFYPNSFYIDLGTTYVPPHINFEICEGSNKKSFAVQIGDGIPYRTLTYAPPPNGKPRTDPLFYQKNDDPDFRTQEQILRDSAFPKDNKYAPDFWGGKPSY
jgi:hypothetical protein